MTTLLDLPSELIASIATHLLDSDIFAIRQTCRPIERATIAPFGKRFFRKKGFMLTSSSLDVLQQIARHCDLRKYLEHVWFNPDCFTYVHVECAPDPGETPDPDDPEGSLLALLGPADRVRYEAYRQCMVDHAALLTKSAVKLQTLLRNAFAGLPNLEVIGMRRSEDHRPLGWRKLMNSVGEDPRVLGNIPTGPAVALSSPTRLFMAIINAIAETNVSLKRLYTDAIEIDNIKPELLPQEVLDRTCRSILYLEVNATRGWLTSNTKRDYISLSDPSDFGDGMVRLLRASPNLKEIGLQIFPDRKQSHILAPSHRNPESWRESYPYLCLQKIVQKVHLQHLVRVKIEKVTTSCSFLEAFLSPSRTSLTSLKLRDVRLLADTNDENARPWEGFFTFLRDDVPYLSYFLLHHLLYGAGGVSFVPGPPLPLPPSETDPTTGAPNPQYGEPAGGELFTMYEHIALEVEGRAEVKEKVEEIVERHWYQKPMFSYHMDDALWHTDTSDEEW